jgi:hypothetical protein
VTVAGSGSPRTLTVRVQRAEIALWREALRARITTLPPSSAPVIARLLRQAHEPAAAGQPWIMVGPTSILGYLICAVADMAQARYADAWSEFGENPDVAHAERLRLALDTTSATMATVFALARVQNDATVA